MKPEELWERLHLGTTTIRILEIEIFPLDDLPVAPPPKVYPIVDKTWSLLIQVIGGHDAMIKYFSRLHAEEEGQNFPRDDDEELEVFLRHGYYWSNAEILPNLITTRSFKFDDRDKVVAYRYRLPFENRIYFFD